MRIIIDMQACQGQSGKRGIGRYSLSLFKSFYSLTSESHEVFVVLNDLYDESTKRIKKDLINIMNDKNIYIMPLLAKSEESNVDNLWRSKCNKYLREFFINQLKPDVVHIMSLFEGYIEPIPASIGLLTNNYKTSVILYDLIPLIDSNRYLPCDNSKNWYFERLKYLKNADFLFSISDYSKIEAMEYLDYDSNKIIPISTDADSIFNKVKFNNEEILFKFNIKKEFILYTGSIEKTDPRKNCDLTILAYSRLPIEIRIKYQLVLSGKVTTESKIELKEYAKKLNLNENDIIFTDWITDKELITFYQNCRVFVFPSVHEGFGLPVLEAIRCGAVTIASDKTSLPEVLGCNIATFNPHNIDDFSEKLLLSLEDENFRKSVLHEESNSEKKFSWTITAKRMLEIIEISERTNFVEEDLHAVFELIKQIEYKYEIHDLEKAYELLITIKKGN